MAGSNESLLHSSPPNTDLAVLQLANAWSGVSHYNIHKVTVSDIDVQGQHMEVYRDSVLRSYTGTDSSDNPRYWLDEILHGNWPGGLTSQFSWLDRDIDGVAASIERIAGERPIEGAAAVIDTLKVHVRTRRQEYVSKHIAALRSFVEAPEDMILWACHVPSIGESPPDQQGEIKSHLFKVAAVEVSIENDGSQIPQVILAGRDGNRGIYSGDLSLYVGRPDIEPTVTPAA